MSHQKINVIFKFLVKQHEIDTPLTSIRVGYTLVWMDVGTSVWMDVGTSVWMDVGAIVSFNHSGTAVLLQDNIWDGNTVDPYAKSP